VETIDTKFDLNLLRVLVSLEETRNVSRAADLLGMSQSGFSTALARLRKRLNDDLFVRVPNGMAPTVRALAMVESARQVLSQVENSILEGIVFTAKTAQMEFNLALTDIAEIVFIPRLLNHLEKVAPGIGIKCSSPGQGQLRDMFETGKLDLALGYFPDLEVNGFYQQRLYKHTFACMVRKDHPVLSSKFDLDSYNAFGHAVVASPARSNDLLDRLLERHKIKRRIVVRTPHYLTLPSIISESNLVASVPLAIADYFARLGLVEVLPLPFAPPVFGVQQYWHRRANQDSAHKWLRDQMVSLFNSKSDPWLQTERLLYGRVRSQN
jgi:DNA-binding transcriptional LysR family regulator